MTTSNTPTVLTRAMCASQLPEGSDPLVVELHLQLTAPERHASRMAAVRAALERFPLADDRPVIARLEVGGIGGPGGYSGDASARMSWARHLGPRAAAWQAAFEAHAPPGIVTPDQVAQAAMALCHDDREWALAHCLREIRDRRLYRHHPAGCSPDEWADAAREIASMCEPHSALCQRYNLKTRPPAITVRLHAADVETLTGIDEASLVPGMTAIILERENEGSAWTSIVVGERVKLRRYIDGDGIADGEYTDDGWEVTVRCPRGRRDATWARIAGFQGHDPEWSVDEPGDNVDALHTYVAGPVVHSAMPEAATPEAATTDRPVEIADGYTALKPPARHVRGAEYGATAGSLAE